MYRQNSYNNRYAYNGNSNWRNRKRKHSPEDIERPTYNSKVQRCNYENSKQFNQRDNDMCNKEPYFFFNRLNRLSEKSSEQILIILTEKKVEFENLLQSEITQDVLVLVLQILTKVCQANFTEIVVSVLSHACSANFIKSLEIYITKLPFETETEKIKNKLYHDDKDKFWMNLIEFFKKIIKHLPIKARDELVPILQKVNLISESIATNQNYKIDEKIKIAALNMSQELEIEIKKEENKDGEIITDIKNSNDEHAEPPENFRDLSIAPTRQDLFDCNPFIRPCKIKDAYDSVEHYLDVQFRLLREDFISPLRNGIQGYLYGSEKHRSKELRIYKNVKLITPEVIRNIVGIKIFFGKINYVNWHHSKRFMHGGLLLLSNDNFNSIFFATVSDRNIENLTEGYVLIEFCERTKITQNMFNTQFVMLESKIYFKPYSSVLNAMKQMNEENFPMTDYLVDASTSTNLPDYLHNKKVLKYNGLKLPIQCNQPWPTAEELNLDETQYSAFKNALTQEFSLIQGPPGTGKTFITLKIVQTLLQNRRCWNDYGPIVVVCLTNHALDQFLEGILKYTRSIVRVGSRSKSENLQAFTLVEKRKCNREQSIGKHMMYMAKRDMENILNSLDSVCSMIKHLTTPEAIVPLACLTEFCFDPMLKNIKSTEELVSWLVGTDLDLYPKNIISKQISKETSKIIEQEFPSFDQLMDDDLEIIHKKKCDSFKVLFPLRRLDELITEARRKIATKEYLNNLSEKRSLLQHELAQHPIINQSHHESQNFRWKSYWKWIKHSYSKAMTDFIKLKEKYEKMELSLNMTKELVDLNILRNNKIIGLTTAGAAKLQSTLQTLCAPIVIIEEAAEILESHVVCSLTFDTQHVILIGDHKQLRPKTSVYELGKKFNLNVSLFERMVNIRGNCVQLSHQHRMRPEIAKLICPSIYEKLENDISVLDYPNIKGLEKNLYFINHSNRETNHDYDDSWINQHEVLFLVELAKYLIKQGYEATEITILCTYTGQLYAFMKETSRYLSLKQVRVTTIDNYQGEENTIILLSLVRNNGNGNIGFLKEENRVCVALSRARHGLYIMGNMDDLVVKNNIWPKIKQELEKENSIGDFLILQCQIHPEQKKPIKYACDFAECPEGGCLNKCDAALSCGHFCTSICHINNRDHKTFLCKFECIKSCPNDHPCSLKCYENCPPCKVLLERQLKCGHSVQMACSDDINTFMCYIEIEVILPNCKHIVKKACGQPIDESKCIYPCENRLPCGHSCRLNCHVNEDPDHLKYRCYKDCSKNNLNCMSQHLCKRKCYEDCLNCCELVKKKRFCGHYYNKILCSVNVDENPCKRPCKRTIELCGHKCRLICSEECGNCQELVEKKSTCGHTIQIKCCEEPSSTFCARKCEKSLACGHACTKRCKDPCTDKCTVMVPQSQSGLCGHAITRIPCYLANAEKTEPSELLQYCSRACQTKLECGHICRGTCGQCKQGRIHISCAEPCPSILICGHACEAPCRNECGSCNKPCELKCHHSKCNMRCGIPCTPCKEPCVRGCRHRKCSKLCFELCNIEPCIEPCKKFLKCGHRCIGYCGDPCPPLCRICNKEILTEILFGDEDKADARFIFLEDCNHCIESTGLLKWLMQSNDIIGMKTCPKCKTKIMKCARIMDIIKKCLKDIQAVKKEVFYKNQNDLENLQALHIYTLKNMMVENKDVAASLPLLNKFLKNIHDRGILVRDQRKQILSVQETEIFGIVVNILLKRLFDALALVKNHTIDFYKFVKSQVNLLVESFPKTWHISKQELKDIQFELQRLYYMSKICKAVAENIDCGIKDTQKDYDTIMKKLTSIDNFTEKLETEVRDELSKLQILSTESERKIIVKAIKLKMGHWFKCPNGHYYVIDDCGGAMMHRKCIECDSEIGGENHRLINTNKLASEMDGASRPAWPQ